METIKPLPSHLETISKNKGCIFRVWNSSHISDTKSKDAACLQIPCFIPFYSPFHYLVMCAA